MREPTGTAVSGRVPRPCRAGGAADRRKCPAVGRAGSRNGYRWPEDARLCRVRDDRGWLGKDIRQRVRTHDASASMLMGHRCVRPRRRDLADQLGSVDGRLRTRGSRKCLPRLMLLETADLDAWADAADNDAGWLLDAWGCPAGSASHGATGRDGMRLGQRPQPTAIGDHVPNVGALVEYAAQHASRSTQHGCRRPW